jgi:HSP20 family protein
MPGVNKEGLEIFVENRRTFELDPSIDTGKISAKIEQGVVTLTLPKAERVKPRKIEVT